MNSIKDGQYVYNIIDDKEMSFMIEKIPYFIGTYKEQNNQDNENLCYISVITNKDNKDIDLDLYNKMISKMKNI